MNGPLDAHDPRYVYAIGCTWHGPIQAAGMSRLRVRTAEDAEDRTETAVCCPHCGSLLYSIPTAEAFWTAVRKADAHKPEYEAMMRWSEGKCFPDFDTLQNAYRQAKEE